MTISQMTTDQAADALVRISCAAAPVLQDAKLRKVIETVASHNEDRDLLATLGDIVSTLVPAMLKDHRENLYEIVSALSCKTVAEVRKQNIMVTLNDAKGAVDEELVSFFRSFGGSKKATDGD